MAGMFYSLKEAAKKLNKTEEELKQIVKEGKLREFRDGPNLLFKVEEIEALMSDTSAIGLEEIQEIEPQESEIPALEVQELEMPAQEVPEPEAPAAKIPEPEAPVPSEQAADTDEILLAPETGAPVVPPSELTDADTALTGEGISVLGETDRDYEVTDDTMAETALRTGTTGTTPEVPLEEIEEDVNLDSFGSGSGLLDLSLQADDTSLGGILDEIYTAEGEVKEPAEAEADSAAAVVAEAEQMISEEELVAPQAAPEVAALARPYIEVAPDTQSNTLGMLLFLPLVFVLYTTVVAVAGLRGVMPSILRAIQGFIWYIMGGAAVVAGLIVGAAFLLTGERSIDTRKQKKPKKPKKGKKARLPIPEDTTA